ncbi:hypothetical protein AX16_005310 [Volvariella volvacea WC 439]|nr:hypothetical protein AX16_005310 [Volvariella volvacea WC 439]
MSSSKLILIVGVTGYVGSNVALELMNRGYSVRGTTRSPAKELESKLKQYYPRLELVQIDNVVTGDFTEVLKGVYAVIYCASPLPPDADPREVIQTTTEGSLNVLRQAWKAGVRKFVLTSSWAATTAPDYIERPGKVFTEKDWMCVQYPDQVDFNQSPLWIYAAAKAIQERAAWDFVKQHPEMDLATLCPPFIYGPFVPHFPVRTTNLATNIFVYALLRGYRPMDSDPLTVDIRDVAKAHVSAMELPPNPQPEAKRFVLYSGNFNWADAAKYLMEHRPDIKDRLPPLDIVVGVPKVATIDASKAMKALKIDKWIPWQTSLNDSVDSLLEVEKSWNEEQRNLFSPTGTAM